MLWCRKKWMGFPLFPFQLLPVSVLKYFHAAEEEEDHHRSRKINASQKPPAPVSSFDGFLIFTSIGAIFGLWSTTL